MTKISINLPNELEFIEKIPNIEWTLIIDKLIKEKLDKIAKLQMIINKSNLSEKDVEELSDKINLALSKRYSI
ncbi:hypothetical protein COU57_00895 [Candidatus Pacearchaeota archaeon CG10_big_fil_rev_8_21_14_0_10_32_14]|nr:MAG: hypothetical protein COU57_00895 [Candidatus Pacearchaeota archaeon CG10_big_fil_rev_8_21_14_0_10_32_14]